jgi:16S rRNA G527 N7-methylase RsmG
VSQSTAVSNALIETEAPRNLDAVAAVLRNLDARVNFPRRQIEALIAEYQRYNDTLKLSAVKDLDGIIAKHVYESALAAVLIAQTAYESGRDVCDLGTGNGFPGLALAAMLPDNRFTLIEASANRAAYLSTCVASMGLTNTRVLNLHLKKPPPELINRFDVISHRAFARIERTLTFARWLGRDDYRIVGFATECDADVALIAPLAEQEYEIIQSIYFKSYADYCGIIYAAQSNNRR